MITTYFATTSPMALQAGVGQAQVVAPIAARTVSTDETH